MREIKFRAWHKTKKAFMYFELSELNDSMITKVEDGWYLDDCDLTQYIGLKDKQGKDIYEGDILLVRFGKHTVEVRWNVTGFGFFNLGTHQWQLLYVSDLKQIEVIGNIYEHSALLEEQPSVSP